MRDPEMCFELGFAGGAHLNPFCYRNDYAGVEQWSRFIRDSHYCFHAQLHEQHEKFAKLWNRNLRQQGFAEAFERQRQQHDWTQVSPPTERIQGSVCAPTPQPPATPKEGIMQDSSAFQYLSIKFILASTLMLSSAEFASDKGLRIVEPYLAYYAIFNVSRSLVLLVPDLSWNDGALASDTTHTKVLNITHDYLRRLDPEFGSRYHEISQKALTTRELFSYSFPALGFDSAPNSQPRDLKDVIGACQVVAELAELHSECLQSAFRRVPPVTLDRRTDTLRKLYEYEHPALHQHSRFAGHLRKSEARRS